VEAETPVVGGDDDFVMSVRAVRNGLFVAETGDVTYLRVPANALPSPSQKVSSKHWCQAVRAASEWKNISGQARGDILFLVHGYNLSEIEVMHRHRRIKQGLAELQFKGVVVSFDWPSDNNALAYLNDRHRAKQSAFALVDRGIRYLSAVQTPDCAINIHLLGHSTGAYVIREAFDDADDSALRNSAWMVSQILFAAADVSAESMDADRAGRAIYQHSVRVTNYSNRHDAILDLSNVKRVGTAPRVGREGLTPEAPGGAVNVDCSDYYAQLSGSSVIQRDDQATGFVGAHSHCWFFGNRIFNRDLLSTIIGVHSHAASTRKMGSDGRPLLIRT
jgi:esterase/lipase superfamily enzyme